MIEIVIISETSGIQPTCKQTLRNKIDIGHLLISLLETQHLIHFLYKTSTKCVSRLQEIGTRTCKLNGPEHYMRF